MVDPIVVALRFLRSLPLSLPFVFFNIIHTAVLLARCVQRGTYAAENNSSNDTLPPPPAGRLSPSCWTHMMIRENAAVSSIMPFAIMCLAPVDWSCILIHTLISFEFAAG